MLSSATDTAFELAGHDVILDVLAPRITAALWAAAERPELDRIVTWDPLWSGKTWLKQLSQINETIVARTGARPFGEYEVGGERLSQGLYHALESLEITDIPNRFEHVLGGFDQPQPLPDSTFSGAEEYSWDVYDLELIYAHRIVASLVEALT